MRRFGIATLVVVFGCGGAVPAPSSGAKPVALVESFDRAEEDVLRDLASIDARFARRARIRPTGADVERVTMAAVLREDASLATVDGAIDPMSFDARARGLSSAKQKADGLPGSGLEKELLRRLVDAEIVRLEDERALPRSASAMVRAFVDGWRPPASEHDAAALDRWLGRRLGEIDASLASPPHPAPGSGSGGFDTMRAHELDDALDALERETAGLPEATRALVRLRESLEGVGARGPSPKASDWTFVTARANAELGCEPDALARSLVDLEAKTRLHAEGASGPALYATGPCVDAIPGSRVRSLAAPDEREPACHLRQLVAIAGDDAGARAQAMAAMHDHVVVALWAIEVARGERTITETALHHRLSKMPPPTERARLERLAVVRPLVAIAAGETVRVLFEGDPFARAQAWRSVGDVPYDIAERELGGAGDAGRPSK
jgi:hypothetical protein